MQTMTWNRGRRTSWLLYALAGIVTTLVMAAIGAPNLMRSRMAAPAIVEYKKTRSMAQHQAGLTTTADMFAPAAVGSRAVSVTEAVSIERKVIRNGSLNLVVDSPGVMLDQVASLTHQYNGYVVSSELTGLRESQRGCITVRVPAAQFDVVREQLKKIAKLVESENTSADDVTMQYAENEATLRNYRAEEASYLEIMRRSGSIKDTLMVAEQLSNVRGEIERLEAEIRTMAVQTEMTALTVNISAEPVAAAPQRWRPFYELQLAWKSGVDALIAYATAMMAILMYVPAVLAWALTIALGAKLTWMLFQLGARLFRAKPSAAA